MFRSICILFAAAFDGEMAVDPIHADAGFALKVANRQVAFYKFNTKYKKARAKIEYVEKNGFLYIYGFKYPAVARGSFIMVDYEENPLKDKLLEAFNSF